MSRAFALKLMLFALPFVLVIAVFTGFLVYIGESMPLVWVVQAQMGDDLVLYRPQFGNRDLRFKALSVNTRQPDVIALGSSRVLQMRAGFLTEQQTAFYNAGAPAWGLDQVYELLTTLNPKALPKIVLLGIDPVWFNDAYAGDEFLPPQDDFAHAAYTNRAVIQAMLTGRSVDFAQLMTRRDPGTGGLALGIKAIANGHGFRNDGSEQYGDFLVANYLYQPTERERHTNWMRAGEQMYVYGNTVSQTRAAKFEALLAFCQAHDMMLIGFTPPYAPDLYQRMVRRGNHTYIAALSSDLSATFAEYGFAYFDFNDGGAFGTDDDFFDGWHGSERVYLRLYTQLVSALPDVLSPYSDIAKLQAIDAAATDIWQVFP